MKSLRLLHLRDSGIAFWDEGDGEPILLVHASFGADWFSPLALLLPGYRVVRSHRAGYGRSRDLSGDISLPDHARHLAAILHAESIARAHVVGHSSGASLTLQLAASYPELVHSMVLLESAFPYAPDEPKSDAMRNAILAANDGDLEGALALFPGSVFTPGYADVFEQALGSKGLEESILSGKYFFDHERFALAEWDSDAVRFESLTQPTLLVDGEEGERLNSPYRLRNAALSQRLPHAQRVSIRD